MLHVLFLNVNCPQVLRKMPNWERFYITVHTEQYGNLPAEGLVLLVKVHLRWMPINWLQWHQY